MRVQRVQVPSSILGRAIPLVRFGRAGDPWVYLPTSGGDEREFERYGLPSALAAWIDTGRVQVLTFDGHGSRTLFDDSLTPRRRIETYARFERAVRDDLLPWLSAACGRDRLDIVGASYGAFVMANLWLKRPEAVRRTVSLGGVFDMSHRFDDFHDDNVYYHTPLEFLPRLSDEAILHDVRGTDGMELYAAADDPWLDHSHRLAHVLGEKHVRHRLSVWDAPHRHHESTWRRQLAEHLGQLYDDPERRLKRR